MNSEPHHARPRRSLWKGPALVAAVFVSLLLLASRLVDGWRWRPGAFVVVGVILFTLGFVYQLVTRDRDTMAYRSAVGISFGAGFVLLWANLVQWADLTPYAALYFIVPVVGLIGAAAARLRPHGMAWALFITALAQASILIVVATLFVVQNPQVTTWSAPQWRGVFGNSMLVLLFGCAGLLFRKASWAESATITG